MDEKGVGIRASEKIVATGWTKLSVRSGQAVVAHGVRTTSKSDQPQLLVIVAARLQETDAKPGQ